MLPEPAIGVETTTTGAPRPRSSRISTERAFEAFVAANKEALSRSIAAEVNHALANLIQALSIARPERLASSGSMERLRGASMALGRLMKQDYCSEGPLVVPDLLHEAGMLQRLQGDLPEAPIHFQTEDNLPAARGNAAALLHALLSLITNAKEAGVSALRISATGRSSRIQIAVEDDGPGLTTEAGQRAFVPFFTTKDPAFHLGLGLPVARHLVRRYGGELRADRRPHARGARFVVTLPLWRKPR